MTRAELCLSIVSLIHNIEMIMKNEHASTEIKLGVKTQLSRLTTEVEKANKVISKNMQIIERRRFYGIHTRTQPEAQRNIKAHRMGSQHAYD